MLSLSGDKNKGFPRFFRIFSSEKFRNPSKYMI